MTMSIREKLQIGVTTSLHLPVRTSDYRAIKVHVEPGDIGLYRACLPSPLSMPETPMLMFELSEVSPTWHEGILSIACRHGEQEGWHGLYWAIDSYFPCVFGRLYGYPKFMAQQMTLTREQQHWIGEVQHKGRLHLHIDYLPQAADGADDNSHSIKSPAEEKPWFLQVPREKGPRINRLTYFEVASPPVDYSPGRARVRFDGDPRFTGLMPPGDKSWPAQLIEKTGNGLGLLYSRRMHSPR